MQMESGFKSIDTDTPCEMPGCDMDADYFIEAVEKHACAACAQVFRMGMEAARQRKVRVVVEETDYGDSIYADAQVDIAVLKRGKDTLFGYEDVDLMEIDGDQAAGYLECAEILPDEVSKVFSALEAQNESSSEIRDAWKDRTNAS